MSDARRRLPAVDSLLADPDIAALLARHPRNVVLRAVRETLESARSQHGVTPTEGWAVAVAARASRSTTPSLETVINATGVVLHTNLGRAPLAEPAVRALERAAGEYAAVEYDVGRGARGSRYAHCRGLLTELTGAEDALVVNNAAAGLLLALTALARGGEAIVSRGELVEIGGSFRIPEIMERSGARLVEVGSTNRTHPEDYARAVTPLTRLLLKVHRSNFTVQGFTTEVDAKGVADLARERGIPSLFDLACVQRSRAVSIWSCSPGTSCWADRRPASSSGAPPRSTRAARIRSRGQCARTSSRSPRSRRRSRCIATPISRAARSPCCVC
jgi:L-seryl-tRNA(Ser) seleniumtransferase